MPATAPPRQADGADRVAPVPAPAAARPFASGSARQALASACTPHTPGIPPGSLGHPAPADETVPASPTVPSGHAPGRAGRAPGRPARLMPGHAALPQLAREQAEAAAIVAALPGLRAARGRPGRRAGHAGRPGRRRRHADLAARKSPPPSQPTWTASRPSCNACCCRATPTTSAMPSSRSAPAPAATSRRCLPPTWRACTCATASAWAGAPR